MNDIFIPYARQFISRQDVQAVVDVLKSDWLTQGPTIERFERAAAEYCGAQYAVAVNSGTSALHIACLAADLGTGDILWTSPNTFVASSNCGLYCGSRVDFVDIDSRTYNLSPAELDQKLEKVGRYGKIPKVVIPVHFAGQSCEMAGIAKLAETYGFCVIEDASHAFGGKYQDTKVGCSAFSDMTVFSFHPVKIITTGEGGMIMTNRKNLYDRLIRLRSHGITRNPELMEGEPHGPWYYQQIELGFNYRMTDIQAALGESQLKRTDEFVARRHFLAKRYDAALQDLPITLPWQHPESSSAHHLYVIRLNLNEIGKTRRQIFDELRAAGIYVNLHYIPVYTQPYYKRMGFNPCDFPKMENYYRETISLPIYFGLLDSEQDYIISKLREVLS